MARVSSDTELRKILQTQKRIAVVGLSPVAARPSFGVTRYMIAHGYEIYGIRPASPPQILNRPCFEKLADLDQDVDLIDVFRNPDALPELMREIEAWLAGKPRDRWPKTIWFQEGVVNALAEAHADRLRLAVVSDLCILKEHARLLG